jgi:hypothetical protein
MLTARLLVGLVGLATVGIVACASSPSATPAAESTSPGAAAGGEAAGGEAPAVLYSDTRYHYRIEAPGHMTANTDGSASFIGPSERLEIVVVQGSQASDPAAMAAKDQSTLTGSLNGFRKLTSPAAITLGGKKVVKFVYSWTAGTNSVTGKPLQLTSVRYYFAKDATQVAVVTYGIVTNQYDPEGADDLARTFQWQ